MTLTDAFLIVTGTIAVASSEDREEAMTLVYAELHRLARRLRVDRDIQEESASYGFQRLVLGGIRQVQSHDAVVQAYLWRIVCSVSHDLLKKKGRELPADLDEATGPLHENQVDHSDPETRLLNEENERKQQKLRLWVQDFVFSAVTKVISDGIAPRYRADFIESMSHFDRLVRGQATFDDLARETFGEVTATSRDRLYQRHCRARRRLFEWVEQQLPSQADMLPEQRQLVRNLIAQFRR